MTQLEKTKVVESALSDMSLDESDAHKRMTKWFKRSQRSRRKDSRHHKNNQFNINSTRSTCEEASKSKIERNQGSNCRTNRKIAKPNQQHNVHDLWKHKMMEATNA